jgi:hypothetical protein
VPEEVEKINAVEVEIEIAGWGLTLSCIEVVGRVLV